MGRTQKYWNENIIDWEKSAYEEQSHVVVYPPKFTELTIPLGIIGALFLNIK